MSSRQLLLMFFLITMLISQEFLDVVLDQKIKKLINKKTTIDELFTLTEDSSFWLKKEKYKLSLAIFLAIRNKFKIIQDIDYNLVFRILLSLDQNLFKEKNNEIFMLIKNMKFCDLFDVVMTFESFERKKNDLSLIIFLVVIDKLKTSQDDDYDDAFNILLALDKKLINEKQEYFVKLIEKNLNNELFIESAFNFIINDVDKKFQTIFFNNILINKWLRLKNENITYYILYFLKENENVNLNFFQKDTYKSLLFLLDQNFFSKKLIFELISKFNKNILIEEKEKLEKIFIKYKDDRYFINYLIELMYKNDDILFSLFPIILKSKRVISNPLLGKIFKKHKMILKKALSNALKDKSCSVKFNALNIIYDSKTQLFMMDYFCDILKAMHCAQVFDQPSYMIYLYSDLDTYVPLILGKINDCGAGEKIENFFWAINLYIVKLSKKKKLNLKNHMYLKFLKNYNVFCASEFFDNSNNIQKENFLKIIREFQLETLNNISFSFNCLLIEDLNKKEVQKTLLSMQRKSLKITITNNEKWAKKNGEYNKVWSKIKKELELLLGKKWIRNHLK